MNRLVLIGAALSALLSGCDNTKTVEWYIEHDAERKAMMEKCNNNPRELFNTSDCVNSGAAVNAVFSGAKNRLKEKK